MTKNYGGPAFPFTKILESDGRTGAPVKSEIFPGMTLRDYFAGQALVSVNADLKRGQEYGAAMTDLAAKAYVIADAMLAARSKT